MSFFDHIKRCVQKGVLVSKDGSINYGSSIPQTDARFVFISGKLNKCFRSQSQEISYNYFNKLRPAFHKLYEYDTYSHLDIFLGKNSGKEIFPEIINELNA